MLMKLGFPDIAFLFQRLQYNLQLVSINCVTEGAIYNINLGGLLLIEADLRMLVK